jgi:alkylation response protein AidB-like acyl-CoA dehydrogenase
MSLPQPTAVARRYFIAIAATGGRARIDFAFDHSLQPRTLNMSTTLIEMTARIETVDWVARAQRLAPTFGARAADTDDSGAFVAENYAELRNEKFFSAGIPTELGGGGATYSELCDVVRTFGQHCGSTALAYAMHSHPILGSVFKYRRGDEAAANVLRMLASGELAVANTGANDWLGSSGNARAVEGGYRISARKRFVSGGPGADLLITSAACTTPDGDEVLHFAVPMTTHGTKIADNWRTLGMRGTGSNDVVLDDVFVPDAAIVARRPAGEWHPLWDAVIPTALPLITAAYVGLAESAAKLAVDAARRQPQDLAGIVGEMLNELSVAQLALADMIRLNDDHGFKPSLALTDAIFARKAIAARAVKAVVEIAAELVGGPGYFKGHALERIVRDIRAMDFHPLPVRRQRMFRGRVALGLDPIEAS